jgi:Diguanylate cyclase, GGDEF domain
MDPSAHTTSDTLQGMADALAPIVPYTSLAVFEVVWAERVLVPLLATGRYVPETLASRPTLENSITGSAVLRAEVVYLGPGDPLLREHVMPGTPQSDEDAILVSPLVVGDRVVGTLNVWREDEPAWFQPEESLLLRVRAARLGPQRNLTVSAGVATSPDSRDDRERLVRSADEHLMRAKREGRDRVVLGEPAGA